MAATPNTSDQRFPYAVEITLGHEGGYVNDPADPGGETKFGISRRSYPDLDIAGLTREQAIAIYRRDWWDRHGYDRLRSPLIAAKVFDLAVNIGASAAHRLLQRAIRASGTVLKERAEGTVLKEDGVLGPQTVAEANNAFDGEVLAALRSEAAGHYRVLAALDPTRKRWLSGWLSRAYS